MREDGVVDAATTQHQKTVWPELSVGYQLSSTFSARGTYKASYGDASYTRLSPLQRTRGFAVVRIEPAANLSVEADVSRAHAELLADGFVSETRSVGWRVAYELADRLSLFGGFNYQSFRGTGNVTFRRGTAPLSAGLTDREIGRVWQAGVSLNATSRIGITGSANFDRTKGSDTIEGEPALYGPISFPYATGTVYYEIPRVGRISVDLQRTYLLQELLPLNNFSANLLTIRYSRGF
jgi:hypothetical protein